MELVCWCGRRNICAYSRALQGCPHENVSHKCAGEPWRAMESHNTSRLLQTCLTRVSQQYLTICPTRPRASHKSFCQEHLQGAVPFFPRKYLSFMRSCAIFLWDIIEGKSLSLRVHSCHLVGRLALPHPALLELAEKWLKCVVVLAKRNLNQCVGFPPLAWIPAPCGEGETTHELPELQAKEAGKTWQDNRSRIFSLSIHMCCPCCCGLLVCACWHVLL